MSAKKILLFSWRGVKHPHAGGAEIVTHEYAKAWVKAGYAVTLFTSAFPGAKLEETIDGVRIIRRGGQILSVQWEAWKWLIFENKESFDLIVDQFHGLPFFTPLYARTKKLAFIHEVTKEVWKYNPLSEPFHSLVSFFGQAGEPFIFRLFYRGVQFLTVSESTKKELTGYSISEQNIKVIYNGVNIVAVKDRRKKPIITFIGAIAKDKGIEDAIKTFALLKNSHYRFWVIGKYDDDYFQEVKKIVHQYQLDSEVKFWGYVSEQKKFELLAQSLVVINPSVREGWGLTVIEAAAMGTPTIGYKVSGLKDAIIDGKTGLLSERKTPADLAELTINLLESAKKYNRMQKEAKKWAKSFDWSKSTKESLLFLKKIMK